ncbi:MAG: MazG family protein, partial [Dehalococcoidia bacterium]|nr:MazG family protein [Dehalococcoidia bacterium]
MTDAPVVHIVGLGPGAPGHLTGEARELLASGLPVILRTRHHPVVGALAELSGAQDCDDLYASGGSFEAVYEAAAGRVLEAAS